MLRNLTLIRLKPGTPEQPVEELVRALQGLSTPGMRSIEVRRDAGLREGNMDLAVLVELEDEEAYRAYDADSEHNRIRRELLAAIVDRVERCQYRV